MPHALHYILIDIVGLAANFCVFRYQIISQVFPKPRSVSLTQVRPGVHTRFLPSPCTLNETQKIARLYVPGGVAHGAYTHVGGNFMRYSIIVIFLFVSTISFGQLPTFDSNVAESDKDESLIYQTFRGQYELMISFTKDCYWPNGQVFYVLGLKAGKWEKFKWTVKFEDGEKIIIAKTNRRRLNISDRKIEGILSFWKENQFFLLARDSLNLMEKVIDRDTKVTMFVTDGCTDRFDVLTMDSYRIVSAYLPDHFQKEIPVLQRQKFILSRDKFLEHVQ